MFARVMWYVIINLVIIEKKDYFQNILLTSDLSFHMSNIP